MTQAFSSQVEIRDTPERVWEALTDWGNAHRWMPGIEGLAAAGDTAPGTRLSFRARGAERASTIASCDPGRSIVLRSVQGGVTADYRYEVRALGPDSTRVTLVADCRLAGFWWRIAAPLLRLAIRMSDSKQLRQLKALIESDRS